MRGILILLVWVGINWEQSLQFSRNALPVVNFRVHAVVMVHIMGNQIGFHPIRCMYQYPYCWATGIIDDTSTTCTCM